MAKSAPRYGGIVPTLDDLNMMNMIDQLFNTMDAWRHLPNYQLERRADLLFSLYLQQVLLVKTGTEINEIFVPEFPVRIGTIYPRISSNKSYKIDYVAVSLRVIGTFVQVLG